MKKIVISIFAVMLSVTAVSNTAAPANSFKDEAMKKAYILSNDTEGTYQTISLEEVKKMLDSKEAILLDVRNPDELEKEGYVPGMVNIPLGDLEARMGELDKEKTYITFCAVGGRSAKAAALLSKNGFKHIYNAKEGIRAWPYEKTK